MVSLLQQIEGGLSLAGTELLIDQVLEPATVGLQRLCIHNRHLARREVLSRVQSAERTPEALDSLGEGVRRECETSIMNLVDFRMEVIPDGPGSSTQGKDVWIFNPANDDLAGVALLMTAEVHCPRNHADFARGSMYEMRIQSPLIPQEGNSPATAKFCFAVNTMEEEEGWNRFKVLLEGKDENLLEFSRIVLWFTDEHEVPPTLEDPQSYNLEEITRFTRRRMPPFRLGEELTVSFLSIDN